VVQFDATRKTLPRLDMRVVRTGNGNDLERGARAGAAWLSSARAVRCWVKSRNERNPCLQLLTGQAENSGETAQENGEEGGDDVKSAWPLCLGLHTCYNGRYKGLQTRKGKRISKNRPQFRSRSATRPREGGIASNPGSARRGEYVPGPCTHRPSHHESLLYLKSLAPTARGQTPTV
jgi:hypothetical protein